MRKPLILCIFSALLVFRPAAAQESKCVNLGFELGDFTGWTGYTWVYSTDKPSANTKPQLVTLPNYRRQVIMTNTSAWDPNTGNGLRMIPRGYRYSARLGDEINNGDPGSFRCWNQSLRYTMTVDSANALLLLKFAVVLQYADNHTDKMEPRFHLQLYDQEGDSLADCANYDVFATATNAKGFRSYQPANGSDPVRWRDWTTVGVNLSSQIGRQVTVEFMSADCTGNFHYGYAYFVAACHPLSITVKYCAGDSVAALSAPEGFEKYRWTDSGGNPISSARILTLDDPQEGSLYSCDMTSATGCTVSLQSTIARYVLNIGFESHMLDCKSNTVQFTNSTTTNKGSLSYWWDFGDGNGSSEINPKYTFSTSGFHRVGLAVENPPSECGDTLWKTIESFSPPLVGIAGDTTYCPGGVAWLKAYGAADYTWSTGSKADSIPAADPNITYWLIGRSTTGCVSDTIRRAVKPEPPWSLISTGDTILCTGSSTLLRVSGAVSYSWDSGETGDSIVVSAPGAYVVTGTNARGCEKRLPVTVAEHGLPATRISLSVPVIDSKHSQLTLSAPGDPGVLYGWDLGDGTPGSGTTFIHSYTVDPLTAAYTIVLTATSPVGCQASDSTTVDVIPFIPNVFSPNGDGINDLFMEGLQAEVFDRNGMKLYSGTTGWDGRFNGRPLDPDTYFYLLQYTNRLGEVKSRKGFITLTR